MEFISKLMEAVEKLGISTVLVLLLITDRIGLLDRFKFWRKAKGDGGDGGELWELNKEVQELKVRMEKHLEKEFEEDIQFALIKNEQAHHKERMEDFSKNQVAMFKMIGEIKNFLMDKRNHADD